MLFFLFLLQSTILLERSLEFYPPHKITFGSSIPGVELSWIIVPPTSPIMEQLHFDYSLKNIPLHSRTLYFKILTDKTANFIRRLRWKCHFILNENSTKKKETYGFKSLKSPPFIQELKPFEDDMYSLIKNIKFRPVNDVFQQTLKNDIRKIRNSDYIFISADKSSHKYKMKPDKYKKLLHDNITADYKKIESNVIKNTNSQAAAIV